MSRPFAGRASSSRERKAAAARSEAHWAQLSFRNSTCSGTFATSAVQNARTSSPSCLARARRTASRLLPRSVLDRSSNRGTFSGSAPRARMTAPRTSFLAWGSTSRSQGVASAPSMAEITSTRRAISFFPAGSKPSFNRGSTWDPWAFIISMFSSASSA